MSGAAGAWRDGRHVLRWFALVTAVIAVANAAAAGARDPDNLLPHVAVAALLAGASLLLAWLAVLAWRRTGPGALRAVLAGVLAYHALFGPALLLTRTLQPVSRDDELVMVLWPHVVRGINSLE